MKNFDKFEKELLSNYDKKSLGSKMEFEIASTSIKACLASNMTRAGVAKKCLLLKLK